MTHQETIEAWNERIRKHLECTDSKIESIDKTMKKINEFDLSLIQSIGFNKYTKQLRITDLPDTQGQNTIVKVDGWDRVEFFRFKDTAAVVFVHNESRTFYRVCFDYNRALSGCFIQKGSLESLAIKDIDHKKGFDLHAISKQLIEMLEKEAKP
jgi:hypothetical protein